MGFVGSMLGLSGNGPAGGGNIGADKTQLGVAANDVYGALQASQNFNPFNNGLQSNILAQQQTLADQLQQQSMGQGPNPAQQALANSTGQNVANQAALMAGQRGAGANAGLIARQSAQQGAATQQQAVGQSALMQAQQQIAAQQALANQQANMGNLASTQNSQFMQNVANQGNLALGNQGQLWNATESAQGLNSGAAQAQAKQQGNFFSGLVGAAGSALMGPAKPASGAGGGGGDVMGPAFAKGGSVPMSRLGKSLYMAKGGKVPAMVSPGEIVLTKSEAKDPKKAAEAAKSKERHNEKVPGKASVKGDSTKNDTVRADLEEGGIVVPRSHSNDPDKAASFAYAVAMKNRK